VRLIAAALAVLALVPASAQAKQLWSARACDAGTCRTITDARTLRVLLDGTPATAPTPAAPFHRVRMTMDTARDGEYGYTMVYVPSAGLMRFGRDYWVAASPRARRAFERLLSGLEPLPARRAAAAVPADVDPRVSRDGGAGGPPWPLVALGLASGAALLVIGRRAAVTS
jgi:hypothetical protein